MTQVITTSVKDLVAAANAEVTTLTVEKAQALNQREEFKTPSNKLCLTL